MEIFPTSGRWTFCRTRESRGRAFPRASHEARSREAWSCEASNVAWSELGRGKPGDLPYGLLVSIHALYRRGECYLLLVVAWHNGTEGPWADADRADTGAETGADTGADIGVDNTGVDGRVRTTCGARMAGGRCDV